MKFSYVKIRTSNPAKPWKPFPLIRIKVFNETKASSLETLALVDSGADKSIFDIEIAKTLGIDLSTAQEENFSGIGGGNLQGKVKIIPIQIVGDREVFDIPIAFSNNTGIGSILGQEGFFDKFSITFKRQKLEFEIK